MRRFLTISIAIFSLSAFANQSDNLRKQSFNNQEIRVINKLQSSNSANLELDLRAELKANNNRPKPLVSHRSESKKDRINLIPKTFAKKTKEKRGTDLIQSTSVYGFSIYDSWVSTEQDLDNDGYFSELTVGFDADYLYGYANVYAKIYLSTAGGDWFHLFTSESFSIYSDEPSDYYSVSLELNSGFPTGQYEMLIDLYQEGYSDIVATAWPSEDPDLFGLFLEDLEHESSTLINFVASELSFDRDADGFYTRLSLEYDIETIDVNRQVFAEIDIINRDTSERVIVETVDFYLGNQTEFVDIDFSSGYPTSYYDFEIRLVDAYSNSIITMAGSEFSSLNALPIESDEYDIVETHIEVEVSGGGSFNWLSMLSLALVIASKRLTRKS